MSIYLGDIKIFNPLSIKARDIEKENILIGKEFSIYENNQIETIRDYAFYSCSSLQSVNLPNASYIGKDAFGSCRSLQSINLPMASYIGFNAFRSCSSLQSVNLPNASYIDSYAFYYCYNLLSLYLDGTSVCSLYASNAFRLTPIAGYTTSTGGVYGSIFVPASLYSDYITANNWSYYSSRIASLMGTVTWGHISADGQRYAQIRDTEGNVKGGTITIVTPDETTIDVADGTYICDEATWDALSPSYGYSRPATFTTGTSTQSLVLLRSDYDEPFIGTLAI